MPSADGPFNEIVTQPLAPEGADRAERKGNMVLISHAPAMYDLLFDLANAGLSNMEKDVIRVRALMLLEKMNQRLINTYDQNKKLSK
jgi:hypothetical protein